VSTDDTKEVPEKKAPEETRAVHLHLMKKEYKSKQKA
jgi:hypothetical protein